VPDNSVVNLVENASGKVNEVSLSSASEAGALLKFCNPADSS
jgi:hypothetical protein